jgi:hypothetical protein
MSVEPAYRASRVIGVFDFGLIWALIFFAVLEALTTLVAVMLRLTRPNGSL